MSKLLPQTWDVPEEIRTRLGSSAGRQRAMFHGGHLLLILHSVPKAGEPDREAAIFWRSPEAAWKGAGAGRGGLPTLRKLLAHYQETIEGLEAKVDHAVRASDYFAVLQQSAPMSRSARNLCKALQAAREAIHDDAMLISLRDAANDIERSVELVHADANNGLEYTIAKRTEEAADLSERIAKSGHRLNLLAALFFPVTAVGTMFGMNLTHGLEDAGTPLMFWAVLVLAFGVGFFVRGSISRAGAEIAGKG